LNPHSTWIRRRKRLSRRIAHDLRLAAPFVAVGICFLASATTIMAAERIAL